MKSPLLAGILAIALAACAGAPASQNTGGQRQTDAVPSASGPANSPDIASISPRTEMVRLALSMRGQPYRYGGAAPGGFDCSGLVQYAASGAGIHVPRTAREQMRAGVPISRGDLHAGDLVFMHLAHKELHVGIVIDDQDFIHSPSAGGYVRVDRLSAPLYSKGFLSARRIVAGP
jgi:cell wall-associated NlpC family hydrolase